MYMYAIGGYVQVHEEPHSLRYSNTTLQCQISGGGTIAIFCTPPDSYLAPLRLGNFEKFQKNNRKLDQFSSIFTEFHHFLLNKTTIFNFL